MSHKSPKIAALIEGCQGRDMPAHYLGYFECFNQRLFYEAHDVLEELWLRQRGGPNDAFFKGLIQLAGAFVHLQKNRLRPAVALFRLSQSYLGRYSSVHERLEIASVLALAQDWIGRVESGGFQKNPLETHAAPVLSLLP